MSKEATFRNLFLNANVSDVMSILDEATPAEVQFKDGQGNTLLHYVARRPDDAGKLIETLIDRGVDPNSRNNEEETPLHVANTRHAVQELVRCGADINIKNFGGFTPLHLAIYFCTVSSEQVCFQLIDSGADVNIIGPDNELPVELAERFCMSKVVMKIKLSSSYQNHSPAISLPSLSAESISQGAHAW